MGARKGYNEQDLKTAAAVGKLEGTVESLSKTLTEGINGIHHRLDKIDVIAVDHDNRIQANENCFIFHNKHHKDFEANIQRKVGFWGLIGSIVGACLAGVVSVLAFFKKI